MRIVILEDDQDQADLLTAWLEEEGHQVTVYGDGTKFVRGYSIDSYDLVMLDWIVPSMNGLDVLRHLRDQLDPVVPVVFITQRDAEEDIVSALKHGADDYMTKPVRHKETMARVNAIARRVGYGEANVAETYSLAPYDIDTKQRSVSYNGDIVEMTQKEYELTLFLFKNMGRVISRGHLLEMVWGTSSQVHTRTIDTHISRLRTKLNIDNEPDWKLTSVYRHGYRLENLV